MSLCRGFCSLVGSTESPKQLPGRIALANTIPGDGIIQAASPLIPTWRVLVVLMAVASAVIVPMLLLGNASGHDFQFHIASWMDAARQWHSGVILPRWAAWANYGFGEPRFVFYPPVSWVLGAGLGTILPWKIVPGVFIWLAIVLAGTSMFQLAREWLTPGAAVAAAVFYAANPYHLIVIYYRSDFAELLASAVLPLAILFAIRLGRGGLDKVVPLAVTFAFIWLSNAPAAVVISYSLALVLAVESVILKSPRVLLRGGMALVGGLGLAAVYILPAAWEQKWVDIGQAVSSGLRPEQNFLFTHANDPEFVLFNWKVSCVALGVSGIAAIAAVFSNRGRREKPPQLDQAWWPLAALGVVAVAMMFPGAAIMWRLLPKMRFVQFPWRWLVPLNLVCWFFFALATAPGRRRWPWWAATGVAITIVAGVMVQDAWWDSEDVPATISAVYSGNGYEGADEYAPLGCNRYDLPGEAPRVSAIGNAAEGSVQSAGVRIHIERWAPEAKTVSMDSARPITLALKLIGYPAWRAEVNGKTVTTQTMSDTMQMLVPLPAGSNRVDVRFSRTPDRTLGGALSLITAAALAACALFRRRKAKLPFRK